MKKCVIYQPSGLGDIFWVQPIVDFYSNLGYEIHYPVCDFYYENVKKYIAKPNIIWHKESDDYPLKNYKHRESEFLIIDSDDLYLPLIRADRFLPRHCSVMISKYYAANVPISNWHKHISINRDTEREQKVFDVYGIAKDEPYILINETFGTPPTHRTRKSIKNELQNFKNLKVVVPNYETDEKNGLNIFDWIGVIENSTETHSVETAFCYLIDKYSKPNTNLFMYEKHLDGEPSNFYYLTSLVYRNPNWTYNIL